MPRLHCPKCHEVNEIAEGAPKACDFCGFGHPGGVVPPEGPPPDPNEGKMPWEDDYDHAYAAEQAQQAMLAQAEEPVDEPEMHEPGVPTVEPPALPAAAKPAPLAPPVPPSQGTAPLATKLGEAEIFRPIVAFKRQSVELDGRRLHWQQTGLGDDHHVHLDLRGLQSIELKNKVRWSVWLGVAWLGVLVLAGLWIGVPAAVDGAIIGVAFMVAALAFGGLAAFLAIRYGRVLALVARAGPAQIAVPIRAPKAAAAKAFAQQVFAAKDALSQPPIVNVEAPVVHVEAPRRRRREAPQPDVPDETGASTPDAPPVRGPQEPQPTNGSSKKHARDMSVDDLLGSL